MRTLLISLLAIVLTPACSLVNSINSKPSDPANLSALAYYQWVGSATVEELAFERKRLEERYSEKPDKAYIQLAVLLSASSLTTAATENRALNLLAAIDPPPTDVKVTGDYALLAQLWHRYLQERTNLRQARLENEKNLEQLQKLQQQVEVLMAIEKQMMEREQAAPE